MTAWLLALHLAAAPAPLLPAPIPASRSVGVYPLRAPAGWAERARALQHLLAEDLAKPARAVIAPVLPGTEDALGACDDAACLTRASVGRSGAIVVPSLVGFDGAFVIGAVVKDDRPGRPAFSVSRSVAGEDRLPEAVDALAAEIARTLDLGPSPGGPCVEAAPAPSPEAFSQVFGLALKLGNTLPTFSGGKLQLSALNLSFDFEADYYATRSFTPFIDASLVLARDASGQSLHLVPLLLGAKYIFRADKRVRPYLGMGLGLGFLSGALVTDSSSQTSFAIYGVGGLAWFPWTRFGFVGEASLNLSGVEVSAQTGVLFAYSFDFGVVALF